MVQTLLEEGTDTAAVNEHGQTLLIAAADKGHVDIVKLLLPVSGIDVDLKDGKLVGRHLVGLPPMAMRLLSSCCWA